MADRRFQNEKDAWILGLVFCAAMLAKLYPVKNSNTQLPASSLGVDFSSWLERRRDVMNDGPIIFVETARRSSLTIRQACAVESAARWNPDMEVVVVMTSPPLTDQPLLRMLSHKFRVNIVFANPAEVVRETPLEEWYRRGEWQHPDFQVVHLSDALRLCLLWRLGGIYLDLDIVVQRPLSTLHNAILTEKEDYLCNAVMAFQPRHGFIRESLLDFAHNYSNETWIANGPVLVTRVVHRYCKVHHTDKVRDTDCDLSVLPAHVGYALEWESWRWFFQTERTDQVLGLFNDSLLVHMWNSQTFRWKARVGSGSAFDVLYANHCPDTYTQIQQGVF